MGAAADLVHAEFEGGDGAAGSRRGVSRKEVESRTEGCVDLVMGSSSLSTRTWMVRVSSCWRGGMLMASDVPSYPGLNNGVKSIGSSGLT